MTELRKAAIELLKSAPDHITEHWPELDEVCKALAQPEQPHLDHYAEVYIRVGELQVKKVLTQIELSHAYDPIKLLSLVADGCVQNIKELL